MNFKSVSAVLLFILLTPVTLAVSFFALGTVEQESNMQHQVLAAEDVLPKTPVGLNIYASLPDTFPSIDAQVGEADARVEIVRQYLQDYNSPLENYADLIVQTADKNGVDFRLVTAIAQQESNLCKFIPDGTYNCWGWGIHSKGTLGFDSYQEGIQVVTEGLKRDYIDQGLVTPEQIMGKYTPLSNGSWARGVGLFMDQMR